MTPADRLRRIVGPLDHLAPEDQDLYVALYLERNGVSRGEAARVRHDAEMSRAEAQWAAWAARHPEWAEGQ